MSGQNKTRVLMIGPDRNVHGGISGVVNNYYEAGLDKKIELYYIPTMVDGSKLQKLFKAAEAIIWFALRLPQYEIVHINMASDVSYYRKSFFIRLAHLAGKKLVIHQHGGDFENFYAQLSEKGKRKVKKILSMGDAFLVLADSFKEFFRTIIDEDKITVLPNAVSVPAAGEKKYGQQKILFLGRLCKEKGIEELLAVMPGLKEKYPSLHLYLGGNWQDKELEEMIKSYHDYITWLGWVSGEEKKEYLAECDIFVLPSYFEGQPVSVLEAMAAACAVVASGTGGIPQMVREGETGILIEPRDKASLQSGLEKLLGDSQLCRQLGERARQKVEMEFSAESNINRLLSIYHQLQQEGTGIQGKGL